MTGSYVLSFREAAQMPEHAGAKAASLGRLAASGFRVPGGFVLSAIAYHDFASLADIRALTRRFARSDGDPSSEWAQAQLDRIRLHFLRSPLPESIRSSLISALTQSGIFGAPLAIRSSPILLGEDAGADSDAGVHRTVLNVLGIDALDLAVRQCWASLWTLPAVMLRRRLGVPDKDAGMAVVVERLASADASGIAYTRNPVNRADEVMINAAWGLGEGIASGRVGPDVLVLRPQAHEMALTHVETGSKAWMVRPAIAGGIVWRSVPHDQQERLALSPEQAAALAETARRIEEMLGSPQELEWARAGDDILLLQARPLTQARLSSRAETREAGAYGGVALWEETHADTETVTPGEGPLPTGLLRPSPPPWGEDIWSALVAAEAFPPTPTPLTWSLLHETLELGFRGMLAAVGVAPPDAADPVRRFAGHPYLNTAAIEWCLWAAFGVPPASTNRLLGGSQPTPDIGQERTHHGASALARLRRRLPAFRAAWRSVRGAPWRLNGFARHSRALREVELGTRSDLDLLELLFEQGDETLAFVPGLLWIGAWGGQALLNLESLLKGRAGNRTPALIAELLAGAGSVWCAEQGLQLHRVAEAAQEDPRARRFLERLARAGGEDAGEIASGWHAALSGTRAGELFEQFLVRFGYGATPEFELMQPRWSEDATSPLRAAAGLLQGIPPRADARERSREAQAAAEQMLGFWGRARLRFLARAARQGARLHENAQSVLVERLAVLRGVTLEIGGRFARRGWIEQAEEIFFLRASEIRPLLLGEAPPEELRSLAQTRRRTWEASRISRLPRVLAGPGRPLAGTGAPIGEDGQALGPRSPRIEGLALAAGRAEGIARVLADPSEGGRLGTGEILIAPTVDPAWAPLLLRAGAVVLEGGGLLSHAAILAREYGLPAVGSIAAVTTRIADGARIAVDGSAGRVDLLDGG